MAWAKHPEGPFTACEKPFITMPLAREWGLKMGYGGQTIDPSIYQEGEEFYLLFGNGHPAIGKLNEKMDGLFREPYRISKDFLISGKRSA